ncbi:MAG: hypothetical protein ACLTXT_02975 [Ruminococcus callidus]
MILFSSSVYFIDYGPILRLIEMSAKNATPTCVDRYLRRTGGGYHADETFCEWALTNFPFRRRSC